MEQIDCILYSISQDAIIDFNFNVNSDALPLTGYDPDLVVYAENTPYSEPEYDSRGFTIITTGTRMANQHPAWPDLLEYRITYSTLKKSTNDLYLAVDNMEAWANEELAPNNIYGSKRQRYNKLLHKKEKGLALTPDEDDYMDMMDTIADAMDDNNDNADQMKDFIESHIGDNQIPDFDAGWTTKII